MIKLLPALLICAVSTLPTTQTINTSQQHPRIFSGLEIQIHENQVTVTPGVCRIGPNTVKVTQKATFTIPPTGAVEVAGEAYVLADDRPQRWVGGTHLKGAVGASGTALPDVLDPNSVVVKLPDGA